MSDLGHEANPDQPSGITADTVEVPFGDQIDGLANNFERTNLRGTAICVAKSATDATAVLQPGKNTGALEAVYIVNPQNGPVHPNHKGRVFARLAEFAISGFQGEPQTRNSTAEQQISVFVRLGADYPDSANQSIADAMDAIQDTFEPYGDVAFFQTGGFRSDQILDRRK